MALTERLTALPTTGFDFDKRRWVLVKRLDPIESDDAVVIGGGRTGRSRKVLVTNASDAHSIFFHDKSALVVSSYRASIHNVPHRRRHSEEFLRFDGPVDHWHPNDLCEIDNEVWATLFSDPTEGPVWNEDPTGRGFLMNLTTGERIGSFTLPHSPTPTTEGIYVCDSGTSSVVLVDRAGRELRRQEVSGFTRGLLVEDKYVIVGVSTHRLAKKENSGATESRFHTLDRATLKEIGVVDVPSSEIYKVGKAAPWHLRRLRRLSNKFLAD